MQFGKKLFVMAMAAIFIVACLIPLNLQSVMADEGYFIDISDVCDNEAVASATATVGGQVVANNDDTQSDANLENGTNVTITVTLNPGWSLSSGQLRNRYSEDEDSSFEDFTIYEQADPAGTCIGTTTINNANSYILNSNTFAKVDYSVTISSELGEYISYSSSGNYEQYGDTITLIVTPPQ